MTQWRIGIVTNLNARWNRAGQFNRDRLINILGQRGLIEETSRLDELATVLDVFFDAEVNLIGINGGDGTYGAVLTEVLGRWPRERWPSFLPLRGGTMNSLARQVGLTSGNPASICTQFARCLRRPDGFKHVPVGSLKLTNSARRRTEYGFVFSNGLGYNFIQRYYAAGTPTPFNAFWVTTKLILGKPLPLPDIQEAWRPIEADIELDGAPHPYRDVMISVCSTVEGLPPYFRPFPLAPDPELGFGVLINCMAAGDVFRHWWGLSRGRFQDPRHYTGRARRCTYRTRAGYLLDGEVWEPEGAYQLDLELGPPVNILVPDMNLP